MASIDTGYEPVERFIAELKQARQSLDKKRQSGEWSGTDDEAQQLAEQIAKASIDRSTPKIPTLSISSLTKYSKGMSPEKFTEKFVKEMRLHGRDKETDFVDFFPQVMGESVQWFVSSLIALGSWQDMKTAFIEQFKRSPQQIVLAAKAVRCQRLDVQKYETEFNQAIEGLDDLTSFSFTLKEAYVSGLPAHVREHCYRNSDYENWDLHRLQREALRQAGISEVLNKTDNAFQNRQNNNYQQRGGGQQDNRNQDKRNWKDKEKQQNATEARVTAADVWGPPPEIAMVVTDRVTDLTDRVTDGLTDRVTDRVTDGSDDSGGSGIGTLRSDCAHQSRILDRACCIGTPALAAHQGVTQYQPDELPRCTCDVYGTTDSIRACAHSGVGAPACRRQSSYVSRAVESDDLWFGQVVSRRVATPTRAKPPQPRISMIEASQGAPDGVLLSFDQYCSYLVDSCDLVSKQAVELLRLVGTHYGSEVSSELSGRLCKLYLDDNTSIVCRESTGGAGTSSSGGGREKAAKKELSEVERLFLRAPSGMSLYERLKRDDTFRGEVEKLLRVLKRIGNVDKLNLRDGQQVFVERDVGDAPAGSKRRKSRWDDGGGGDVTMSGDTTQAQSQPGASALRGGGAGPGVVYLNHAMVRESTMSDAGKEAFQQYYGCPLDTIEGARFLKQHENKGFLRGATDVCHLTPVRTNTPYLIVRLNNHKIRSMSDTGATHSIISQDLVEACGLLSTMTGTTQTFAGVNTSGHKFAGMLHGVDLAFGDSLQLRGVTLAVMPTGEVPTFIIGNDLLGGPNSSLTVLSDNRSLCLMTIASISASEGQVETIPYLKNVESIRYPSRPVTTPVTVGVAAPDSFRDSLE